jgi:hypothetical protein
MYLKSFNLLDRHSPNEQQFSFHMYMVVENLHDMLFLILLDQVQNDFVIYKNH